MASKYTKAGKVKMQEKRRLIRAEAAAAVATSREPIGVVTALMLERLREYEDHAEEAMKKLKRSYSRVTVSNKYQSVEGDQVLRPLVDPPVKAGQDADDVEGPPASGQAPSPDAKPTLEPAPTYDDVKSAFGTGATKGRFMCDACGKNFTTEGEAARHIALEHTPVHEDGTAWEPPSFREVPQPQPEPETRSQAQPGANGGPSGAKPAGEPKVTKTRPPLRVPLPPDKLAKTIIAAGYKQELANRQAGFPGMPDVWWPIAEVMLTDYFEELALKGWDLRRFRGVILGGGALVTTVQTVRRMRDGGARAAEMAQPQPQQPAQKPQPQPVSQQRDTASNNGSSQPGPAQAGRASDEAYVAGPSKPVGV